MISTIQYASMFAYSPRGIEDAHKKSRDLTYGLKEDRMVGGNVTASKIVAHAVYEMAKSTDLFFAGYFGERYTLVPVPRRSLHKQDVLWVPLNLALHMKELKLGRSTAQLAKRVKTIPSASKSLPGQRPTAIKHYETVKIEEPIQEISDIILVDDVVTTGATILGVASKLAERFPNSTIKAFAAVRTISNAAEFTSLGEPVKGTITLHDTRTIRRP